MANKYPYVKSTSEPLGLKEQLELSITMRPSEDPATTAQYSWFGRLLSDDRDFIWVYTSRDGIEERYNKQQLADAYFSNSIRYTLYDSDCPSPQPYLYQDKEVCKAEGLLRIKGTSTSHYEGNPVRSDHCGTHIFAYKMVKEDGKWRLRECKILQVEANCSTTHGEVYE